MANRTKRAGFLLLLALVAGAGCAPPPPAPEPARYAAYAGRYAADRLAAVEVEATDDLIAVVPPFWTSKPYFASDDGTTFRMELPSPRHHRKLGFGDFENGAPSSLTMTEVDRRYDGKTFRRLAPEEPTALGRFLAGDPEAAAELALQAAAGDEELATFALNALLNYRSRHADSVRLLERLQAARPENARLRSLYAHALVAVGRRDEALPVFEAAEELDAEEWTVAEGLRRLRFEEPPPDKGYRAVLPFQLAEAFAPPSADEIAAVRASWSARDLRPRGVSLLARSPVALDHARLEARVLRHVVHDDAHHGVVFVPEGAAARSLPAVVDVRGVNPTYSPMDVSRSTKTQRALGPAQSDFVFLVPGLRGNTLIFDGVEYVSEGDPSDAWDGATDDALAFLDAALEVTPEIDPERIAIVGYSRGGTVALLAGIRDPRIDLVLNVVGPVDHFVAMDTMGWTTPEVLADALRDETVPEVTEEGGQDFDHWLDRVLEGETLAEVRARLVASSPIYFVEELPRTHSFYGSEDRSVPLANARLLRERLAALGRLDDDATVRVFAGRGHDTDPLLVQRETTRYLSAFARW